MHKTLTNSREKGHNKMSSENSRIQKGEYQDLNERFEFRDIRQDESAQASEMEVICFPPNEVIEERFINERIKTAPDMFLVAEDKRTGRLAGCLSGIAVREKEFRDDYFKNAALHDPDGKNVMLLGLNVLPEYRMQGLARMLMNKYGERERDRGRSRMVLTCADDKIEMYTNMGFREIGRSASELGGEEWNEMDIIL